MYVGHLVHIPIQAGDVIDVNEHAVVDIAAHNTFVAVVEPVAIGVRVQRIQMPGAEPLVGCHLTAVADAIAVGIDLLDVGAQLVAFHVIG